MGHARREVHGLGMQRCRGGREDSRIGCHAEREVIIHVGKLHAMEGVLILKNYSPQVRDISIAAMCVANCTALEGHFCTSSIVANNKNSI